jgi:hypothetical protein
MLILHVGVPLLDGILQDFAWTFIHSFIPQSVVQVHSLFQSHFSTQRNLMLPLSISSILSFP